LSNFIKIADKAERDLVRLIKALMEQISLTEDDIDMEMKTHRTVSIACPTHPLASPDLPNKNE
jgi:hypothetical protein